MAPDSVRCWLTWPTSLTHALEDRFGPVQIRVTLSAAVRALDDEAAALGLRMPAVVQAREVDIAAGGRIRISARSVAGLEAGNAARHLLRGLGGRSLGSQLFGTAGTPTPRAERRSMRFAHRDGIWARRTSWRIGGADLVVTEIFHAEGLVDEAPGPRR